MQADLTLRAAGLFTDPNPHSDAPHGALRLADNVVIRRAGVLEPRPGFRPEALSVTGDPVRGLYAAPGGSVDGYYVQTEDALRTEAGTALTLPITDPIYSQTPDVVQQQGQYQGASSAAMRGHLYVPTRESGGTAVVRASTIDRAGAPTGPNFLGAAVAATPGWLPSGESVRYRLVVRRDRADGLVVRGAPSGPQVITGGVGLNDNVTLTIYRWPDMRIGDHVEVYRSPNVAGVPSDELFLAGEVRIGALAATVTFTDDGQRTGASLYTNATQDGATQANSRPPESRTIARYGQMIAWGGIYERARFLMQMTRVPDDTSDPEIDINGLTYAFTGAGFDPTTGLIDGDSTVTDPLTDFDVPCMQLAISITTRAIAGLLPYYATYLGGGIVLVEEVAHGAAEPVIGVPMYVQTNDVPIREAFLIDYGQSQEYLSVDRPGRLRWSKLQQPEHAPELNFVDLGDAQQPIVAMAATRRALFVAKTDGIWAIRGDTPQTLRADRIDSTARVLHPHAMTAGGDRAFAWTDGGVVAMSDAGVEGNLSAPAIEIDLRAIQRALALIEEPEDDITAAFVAYEDGEERLLVGVPPLVLGEDDPHVEHVYVYDMRTQAWTRWIPPGDWTCALSTRARLLFGGSASGNGRIWGEVASTNEAPHADETIATTALTGSSLSGSTYIINTGIVSVTVPIGSWVAGYGVVTGTAAVGSGGEIIGTALTVEAVPSDSLPAPPALSAAVTVYLPVDQCIEWIGKTATAPTAMKRWGRGVLTWERDVRMYQSEMSFRSDLIETSASVTLEHVLDDTLLAEDVPFVVTRDHTRAAILYPKICIAQAGARWAISALHLDYSLGSVRVGRRER